MCSLEHDQTIRRNLRTRRVKQEPNHSHCVECGKEIFKGDFMCDDCYWWIREGNY